MVVALLVFFLGALGLALRDPTATVALQAAQGTLASLCGAARTRAALTGSNVRLAVAADPAGALRYWQIVQEDPATPGCWLAEGGGFWLPRGIYAVPPPAVPVPGNPAWPGTRRSTALSPSAQAMTINHVSAGLFFYLQYTPRGTTGGGNLVLTTGRVAPDPTGFPCRLDQPDAVRGVLLRSSGALTLLNDAAAFDP